jgi:hypothetical protein
MDGYYENLQVGQLRDLKHIIGIDAFWRDVRFEYSDDKPIFVGRHFLHNMPDDNDQWEVWKYTWNGEVLERKEGPLPGKWSDRNKLQWETAGSSMTVQKADNNMVQNDLLSEIRDELKIMNVHLQSITDEEIENDN